MTCTHPTVTTGDLAKLMNLDDPEVRHRMYGKRAKVPCIATCTVCRAIVFGDAL